MCSLLFGVPAADPLTFSFVALLCLTTVVHGVRATHVSCIEPISSLRAD
jgi:hypothetical protein